MQITEFSYRFAFEVLDSPGFSPLKNDVLEILASVQEIPTPKKPKIRTRDGKTWNFTTDQIALNKLLDNLFLEREWLCQPPVTNDKVTAIKADYKKGRVQVEAQFGNMALVCGCLQISSYLTSESSAPRLNRCVLHSTQTSSRPKFSLQRPHAAHRRQSSVTLWRHSGRSG